MGNGFVSFLLHLLLPLLLLVGRIHLVQGYCHRSRWGTVSCCSKPKGLADTGLVGDRRISARSVSSIASLLKPSDELSAAMDSATPHHDPWQPNMSPTRPTTDDERLKVATACDTIHHVKQRFESSYTLAIAPHYRTYVLDLLAFTHVQRQQTHFQYDAIYALGLCTQFYSAMRHYAVPQEIDSIFNAMVIALQLDPQQVRRDAKRLIGLAKGRPTPLIDNLPPAELFTVVDTNPGNKEFPLTDAWAVGLGRLIELYGAVPSETIFRRWNRRGVNNARLMAAWSEFQADSQRLFNLECIQQQLLQSPATYWPPHRRVAPGALFQQERREALQQLNANLSVNR